MHYEGIYNSAKQMKNQQSTEQNEYLIIPNPIYDVVFRYLMQDYDSAMIILSTLINEKIIKLDFQPLTYAKKKTTDENTQQAERLKDKRFEKERKDIQSDSSLSETDKQKKISEITIKDPKNGKDIKLLHHDTATVIEKENGEEELVIIELQKVAIETDIFRFKQYISENFQKKRKVETTDPDTGQKVEIDFPYRLIPIFILNFEIEAEISDLMIKTRQIKTGIFTGKELNKKNEFIDNLSYELYVIQLPYLNDMDKFGFESDEYRSKLYALLKLFDQQAKKTDNEYRLRVFRRLFPKFLDHVIERLQRADIHNPNLEKQMQAEDHYLKPLLHRDNKISWLLINKKQTEKKLHDTTEKLENTTEELENTTEKLENTTEKLENTTEELENTTEKLKKEQKISNEKDKELKFFKLQYTKTLKNNGKTTDEIQKLTDLSKEEIDKL